MSSKDYTTQPLLKTNQNYDTNTNPNRRRTYGATASARQNSNSSSIASGSNSLNGNNEDGGGGGGGSGTISSIPEHRSTMSFMHKFGFGLGHIYNDLCAGIWFSYTLLYLKSALLIPAPKAGGLVMLGQISDAIATPIVGILADRFSTKRQWHIYGTILVLLTFPMIFSLCPFCDTSAPWWPFVYFSIFIMLFQFGWACVQITHFAMIPEMSITEKDRSDLTATRYSASVCANIVVYVITWAVLKSRTNSDSNNIGPSDTFRFRDISLILTLIGVTMTVLFHFSLAISGYEKRRLLAIQNHIENSNNSNQKNSHKIENGYQSLTDSNIENNGIISNDEEQIAASTVVIVKRNDRIENDDKQLIEPSTSSSYDGSSGSTSTATINDTNNMNSSIIVNGSSNSANGGSYKNFFKTKLLYQNAMLYVFARLFMTTALIYLPLWLDQRSYVLPSTTTTTTILSQINENQSTTLSAILQKDNENDVISIEHLATVPLASFIASFLAAMILKNFNLFLGHRTAYFIGSVISLIGCIWIVLKATSSTSALKLYLVAVLFGSGSSITMISSLCITADMIGGHTYQGGFIYSAVTFADKLITGIVIVVIETLKCDDRADCPEYYRNILAYGCGLASTLGLIVLISLMCNKKSTSNNGRRRVST